MATVAHDITIRRIPLPLPEVIDPLVVPGEPEQSFVNIGVSLLLPYLEPYLIRSMNAAKAHVDDEALLADIEGFNGQEGQHFRQHKRFNDAVRAGFDGLAAFEAEIDDDYRRFSEKRSLRFNLAYAEGFEALTMALARVSLEQGLIDRIKPEVRDLFLWHLIEELEHRTVAFEVYRRVCGGYLLRLLYGLYAQWHMSWWIARVALSMWWSRREEIRREHGGLLGAARRLLADLPMALRHFFPKVVATWLPGYDPSRVRIPERFAALARHYTEVATSTSHPG